MSFIENLKFFPMLDSTEISNYFYPPVVIEKNEIDYVINALKQTIDRPPLMLIINFVKNYLLRLFNKD